MNLNKNYHDCPNSSILSPALRYNSFGDSPIYYYQSFIMQVFANILPYQYFATYSSYLCGSYDY